MGAEIDIYNICLEDTVKLDKRENEVFTTVFKKLFSKEITKDFQNSDNKYSKILAYIINDYKPELIYASKCNSFSELTEEINNLAEIVERRQIHSLNNNFIWRF